MLEKLILYSLQIFLALIFRYYLRIKIKIICRFAEISTIFSSRNSYFSTIRIEAGDDDKVHLIN